MCRLTIVSTQKKIEGYKIVAKKLRGKRYYSIAMGFKYPLDGHVPTARKQNRICSNFMSDILSVNSTGYKKQMAGRTAVYLSFNEALDEYHHLPHEHQKENIWSNEVKKGYKLVIVRSEISVDIMEGYYSSGREECKVAAGRHIRFIEEIEELNLT